MISQNETVLYYDEAEQKIFFEDREEGDDSSQTETIGDQVAQLESPKPDYDHMPGWLWIAIPIVIGVYVVSRIIEDIRSRR